MRALILTAVFAAIFVAHAEDSYPGDEAFTNQVVLHGMFDIAAGNLAVHRSSSPAIKTFGAKLTLDHQKLNEQLRLLARNKGWRLPERHSMRFEAMLDQYSEESVKDFESDFIKEQALLTKSDTESFRNASKYAADEDLRSWAAEVLPTLVEDQLSVPQLTERVVVQPAKP